MGKILFVLLFLALLGAIAYKMEKFSPCLKAKVVLPVFHFVLSILASD